MRAGRGRPGRSGVDAWRRSRGIDRLGGIDIVVNNAGVGFRADAVETTLASFFHGSVVVVDGGYTAR